MKCVNPKYSNCNEEKIKTNQMLKKLWRVVEGNFVAQNVIFRLVPAPPSYKEEIKEELNQSFLINNLSKRQERVLLCTAALVFRYSLQKNSYLVDLDLICTRAIQFLPDALSIDFSICLAEGQCPHLPTLLFPIYFLRYKKPPTPFF